MQTRQQVFRRAPERRLPPLFPVPILPVSLLAALCAAGLACSQRPDIDPAAQGAPPAAGAAELTAAGGSTRGSGEALQHDGGAAAAELPGGAAAPAAAQAGAAASLLATNGDASVPGQGADDVSVDELLAAAETALGMAAERVEAGDTEGYRLAMAEVLSYLDEAQGRLVAEPATFPSLRSSYDKLLGQLRESIEPSATDEDVLGASAAELAGTPEAAYANGATYEMPIDPDNRLVQKYLALFQRGKRRAYIQAAFDRSGPYKDFVQAELRKRGLPEELWVVPIIESGYKTSAYSRTRAVGIWQFMANTARHYGLLVNEWLDERRDPVKSTHAALDYLKDLYLWFNNWDFALAAYNRGEHGIHRDIKNSGIVDFMQMAELGATQRETSNHVPQIHAAAIIAKHPQRYDFHFRYEPAVAVDTVSIDYVVDLGVAAQCAGTTEKTVRQLNPELRTWVTPLLSPEYPAYRLKLPRGTRERYMAAIAKVSDKTPKRQIRYVVRRGDTLGSIGRRFGVSWKKIQRWNNLRSSRIYPGQKLVILPGRSGGAAASAAAGAPAGGTARRAASVQTVSGSGGSYRVYTVRRGDTLTHIARDFGVTVKQLQAWNGVRSRIVPGQKVKIVGGGGSGGAAAAAGAGQPVIYVVKKGDSLSRIARLHRTSVANLRRWNKLGRYLHPGQRIKIYATD